MFRAIAPALLLLASSVCALAADIEVVHYLPFPEGKRYQVFQGNDQGPSHNDKYNRHAFDFSPLPVGSEVAATAGGTVTFVRESTEGPTGNWRDNNMIAIDHGDGTVGLYEHLRKDGALVDVGDVVVSGDLIGYSGNTGNSVLPHLHFSLRKGTHMGESVPCRFADVEGDGVPDTGDSVQSGNVALRGHKGLAAVERALALYETAASLGCIEAALPILEDARDAELPTRQIECLRVAARRSALVARREAAAAELLAGIAANREEGDVAGAVRAALKGADDFEDTPSYASIKKALRELRKDPAFTDANAASQGLLKYRRQMSAAFKQITKAEAALAKVKPGKKPPSRPYRHAIAALERAAENAPEQYADTLQAYIASLPTE